MFEAVHSERTSVSPEAIWELWADPQRWPEWDQRVESAELEGELEPGAEIRVKLHKGGTTRHIVVEVERGRLLATEYGLPGALAGHERRLAPGAGGSEVTHRLYVNGPLSGFWALMLGRGRMRDTVAAFTDTP